MPFFFSLPAPVMAPAASGPHRHAPQTVEDSLTKGYRCRKGGFREGEQETMQQGECVVHRLPVRRSDSRDPSLPLGPQTPSAQSVAVIDASVAGGSVGERRFVMVSASMGARISRPGEWATGRQPVAATHCSSAWRLLGANNRELARSFTTYPDAGSCAAAIKYLQTASDRLVPAFLPGLRRGRWFWQTAVDDVPLAASARSFALRRDCEQNFEQFLAVVSAGVVVTIVPAPGYSGDGVLTTT